MELDAFVSGPHMTLTGKLRASFYFLYKVLMEKFTGLHWKYIFKISLNRIQVSFAVVNERICFYKICGVSNTELVTNDYLEIFLEHKMGSHKQHYEL
jgi:hypothetical protein